MTKATLVAVISVATLAALAPVSIIPQARAGDAEAPCPGGNATLHGTYIVNGGGTLVGLGPASAVGVITYDGSGRSVNTFTVSQNGSISKGVTVRGPYTVNPNCTGSLSQSDGTNYDFVVTADGSTVYWIETDAGTVVSGTEIRQ
jgi:hypothetical protein